MSKLARLVKKESYSMVYIGDTFLYEFSYDDHKEADEMVEDINAAHEKALKEAVEAERGRVWKILENVFQDDNIEDTSLTWLEKQIRRGGSR